MGSADNSPNPWAPYDTYRDCSQGVCSYYCPQWCYIIFPPPPPFDFGDQNDNSHDSSADFSPLIIAVIGILASAFILLSYYTIISKYCRRRRGNDDSGGGDPANDNAHQTPASDQSFQSPSSGLEERLIKSIKVYKYKKGDGFVEGSDCSVCLSEFEENEGLRLLPKCNHAFHVPCIDTWLKSHSSCPLCRSNIAPYVTDVMPQPELSATTVSALEYQSRSNDAAAVVIVVEDSESGFREEVFGVEGDEPKTPTGDVRGREEEFRDHGVQIQPLRRSVSLNCHAFCHDRLSVADILRAEGEEEEDDDDLIIRIEKDLELLSMGIGTSSKGEEGVDHFKSNDRGGGVLSLVRSPLAMKRSISTGRFMLTRHGKGKNTIIHN